MGAESESWKGRARGFFHRLFDARRDRRMAGSGEDLATFTVRAKDHQVAILDISSSGAMITFDGLAREGDPVTLRLSDQGPVRGQVRWVRDGKAGIYFVEPLSGIPTEAQD